MERITNPSIAVPHFKCRREEIIFSTNEDVIDVKPFAKGMYYLRVEGQVKKVVVE